MHVVRWPGCERSGHFERWSLQVCSTFLASDELPCPFGTLGGMHGGVSMLRPTCGIGTKSGRSRGAASLTLRFGIRWAPGMLGSCGTRPAVFAISGCRLVDTSWSDGAWDVGVVRNSTAVLAISECRLVDTSGWYQMGRAECWGRVDLDRGIRDLGVRYTLTVRGGIGWAERNVGVGWNSTAVFAISGGRLVDTSGWYQTGRAECWGRAELDRGLGDLGVQPR